MTILCTSAKPRHTFFSLSSSICFQSDFENKIIGNTDQNKVVHVEEYSFIEPKRTAIFIHIIDDLPACFHTSASEIGFITVIILLELSCGPSPCRAWSKAVATRTSSSCSGTRKCSWAAILSKFVARSDSLPMQSSFVDWCDAMGIEGKWEPGN